MKVAESVDPGRESGPITNCYILFPLDALFPKKVLLHVCEMNDKSNSNGKATKVKQFEFYFKDVENVRSALLF
jgi:hypothetical protein